MARKWSLAKWNGEGAHGAKDCSSMTGRKCGVCCVRSFLTQLGNRATDGLKNEI